MQQIRPRLHPHSRTRESARSASAPLSAPHGKSPGFCRERAFSSPSRSPPTMNSSACPYRRSKAHKEQLFAAVDHRDLHIILLLDVINKIADGPRLLLRDHHRVPLRPFLPERAVLRARPRLREANERNRQIREAVSEPLDRIKTRSHLQQLHRDRAGHKTRRRRDRRNDLPRDFLHRIPVHRRDPVATIDSRGDAYFRARRLAQAAMKSMCRFPSSSFSNSNGTDRIPAILDALGSSLSSRAISRGDDEAEDVSGPAGPSGPAGNVRDVAMSTIFPRDSFAGIWRVWARRRAAVSTKATAVSSAGSKVKERGKSLLPLQNLWPFASTASA